MVARSIRLFVAAVALAVPLAAGPSAGAEGSWEVVPSPSPGTVGPFANELQAASGTAANDVWAVGAIDPGPYDNSRATLAMHFDGTSWSVVPTPNPDGSGTGVDVDFVTLTDVEAITPTDAWAVGQGGSIDQLGQQAVLLRWNGTAWSSVPVPRLGGPTDANSLWGISAVSSTDIWAVGGYTLYGDGSNTQYGTLLLHWDGSTWSIVPNGCDATEDVVAISGTDVWAVGNDTCHWSGTTWTPIPNASSNNNNYVRLRSVSAASSGDVWTVGFEAIPYFEGYRYRGRIERWDGSKWTALIPQSSGDHLDGVLAVSPTDAWAVGSDYGNNLILHWDGSAWTPQEVPSPGISNYLNGVGAAGADLWAVGITFDANSQGRTLTVRRTGSAQVSPATVKGTVRSYADGQVIAGATVSWTGPQSGATTTSTAGKYQMTSSSGGAYSLTASATGCRSRTISATLSPGQTLIRNFRLRCG